MTPRQQILRIQTLLQARNWPGGANRVFSRAVTIPTGIDPWSLVGDLRTPYAMIAFTGARADPEHPELLTDVTYDITVVVDISNDKFGEGTIIGAGIGDATRSEGQGLLRVVEEVFAVLGQIDPATDGFRLRAKTVSAGQAVAHQGRTLAASTISVQAIGTMTVT